MDANQWRVTSILAGPKLLGVQLLLRGCKIWVWQIVVWLCGRLPKRLEWVKVCTCNFAWWFEHGLSGCEICAKVVVARMKSLLFWSCTGSSGHTLILGFGTLLTGAESWVYGYHSETKRQSLHWKPPESPKLKKVWQVWSKMKVMLSSFMYVELCITNTHWKNKQWQRSTIKMFSGNSVT